MFDFISLCLVKVKNIITFLITGKITIPMYGLYIIISLSATLGLFVATLCFAAKEADRRIEMVNTVELARIMRKRERNQKWVH